MKLTMLGTGHAMVTQCYNTCFLLHEEGKYLLVDGGGGNGIFHQLQAVGVDWHDIKQIILTHKHTDHLLGILWLVRAICQGRGNDTANPVYIYGNADALDALEAIARILLPEKATAKIGSAVHLIPMEDGECRIILGYPVTFFDIHSEREKQFGFSIELASCRRVTCCGDETYRPEQMQYVQNSCWLLHEAFTLSVHHPGGQNGHGDVATACMLAQKLGVKNLVLYHTEDKEINTRKKRFVEQGKQYFSGNLYVPEDLETIELTL